MTKETKYGRPILEFRPGTLCSVIIIIKIVGKTKRGFSGSLSRVIGFESNDKSLYSFA